MSTISGVASVIYLGTMTTRLCSFINHSYSWIHSYSRILRLDIHNQGYDCTHYTPNENINWSGISYSSVHFVVASLGKHALSDHC